MYGVITENNRGDQRTLHRNLLHVPPIGYKDEGPKPLPDIQYGNQEYNEKTPPLQLDASSDQKVTVVDDLQRQIESLDHSYVV